MKLIIEHAALEPTLRGLSPRPSQVSHSGSCMPNYCIPPWSRVLPFSRDALIAPHVPLFLQCTFSTSARTGPRAMPAFFDKPRCAIRCRTKPCSPSRGLPRTTICTIARCGASSATTRHLTHRRPSRENPTMNSSRPRKDVTPNTQETRGRASQTSRGAPVARRGATGHRYSKARSGTSKEE